MANYDNIVRWDGQNFYNSRWEDLGNRDREVKTPLSPLNEALVEIARLRNNIKSLESRVASLEKSVGNINILKF